MNTRLAFSLAALAAAFGLAAAHPAAAGTSTIALQNGGFVGNYQSNNVNNFTGSQTYFYAYGYHSQDASGSTGPGLYINGGSVYQFLGTTGAAGETLTLNGFICNFTGDPDHDNAPPLTSTLEFTTAAPTAGDDLASGSVLASDTLTSPTAANTVVGFAPFSYTTTAANQGIYLVIGGPDIATYGMYGAQSNYQNFSLTDTPAAVPEASSLASLGLLLALGLGGFAVARKRNASAV